MHSPRHTASDPAHSVWVSANAGSGKTKVLTDRVLRLLLGGTYPSRILCITYTNAATAEMKNRIYKQLSTWVALDDAKLVESLWDLTGSAPDADMLLRARGLFAGVIESPEGIRIQTIHALCQSLLRRFPVEAGVPPHFAVIDENVSRRLIEEARRQLLTAHISEQTPLAHALQRFASRMSEQTFTEMLEQLVGARRKLQLVVQPPGGLEKTQGLMRRAVMAQHGLDASMTLEQWMQGMLQYEPDAIALIRGAIAMLEQGGARDISMAQGLAHWWSADSAVREKLIPDYVSLFITQELEPKKELINKKLREKLPALEDALRAEQQRMFRYVQVRQSLHVIEHTEQILVIAEALLHQYRIIKDRTSSLDFEDQILLALQLLSRDNIAPWILYKLDGGLDHVLIDEAQDTSPVQWKLLAKLVEEFFSGHGARMKDRTIFVVGDEKQSIFSFQDADPREFDNMQRWFARKLEAAKKPFRRQPLNVSYRSTESVLKAVDAVFSEPAIRQGVVMSEGAVMHEAHRSGQAGRVECWELVEPEEKTEQAPWKMSQAAALTLRPETKLARRIAATIRGWLDDGRMLEAKGRPVRPGDIMLLVRSRSRIVGQLLRALRRENIPVAGSDRLMLGDDIAVMDMMALFRFLLLPQDSMSLAIVLKSPLIGLSEEDLFTLAHDRGEDSLWERLHAFAPKHKAFAAAFDWLALALSKTDLVAPFELISLVLESWEGRKRFIARLGHEVEDPLSELLSLALRFESEEAPSLQGFLHWMESREALVKRDMEQGRDEVRILTVHGSKGLQSPIIFLPDTARAQGVDKMPLHWSEQEDWFVWAPSAEDKDVTCKALHATQKLRAEEEGRRLLYVAMTRAEDELYICGYKTDKTPVVNWHSIMRSGLSQVAVPVEITLRGETWQALRLENPQTVQRAETKTDTVQIERAALPLPVCFLTAPSPEPALPKPLSPSQPTGRESALLSPVLDAQRILRGTLIHTLLQYLPDIEPSARPDKIATYLASRCKDTQFCQSISAEILALLENPLMQPFLAAGGVAEAPISGVLINQGLPVVVSGQIDRLVVKEHEVWVLDYKTGRHIPQRIADIPEAYIRQMQIYRDLLRGIYPQKAVRSALLWTSGPQLHEIPDALMDALSSTRTLDAGAA